MGAVGGGGAGKKGSHTAGSEEVVIYFVAAHCAPLRWCCLNTVLDLPGSPRPSSPALCTENEERCCGLAEHRCAGLPEADLSREKGTSPNQVQNIKRHLGCLPKAANRGLPPPGSTSSGPPATAAPWRSASSFLNGPLALPFPSG